MNVKIGERMLAMERVRGRGRERVRVRWSEIEAGIKRPRNSWRI